MRKWIALGTVLAGLCACEQDQSTEPLSWSSQAVEDAWTFLDWFLVFRERLPAEPMAYETPPELYASVREPYTVYYTHPQAEVLVSLLTSETVDAGVHLDSVRYGAAVLEVYAGSPAEAAGIRVGDTILSVNGVSCAGQPVDTVLEWLTGAPGERLQLAVWRSTGQVAITVVLAAYLAPTVFTDSLDSAVAYVALSGFFDETPDIAGSAGEFHAALARTAWARYTIVDLRDNPGGYVTQCLRIAGEFVPLGTAVVRTTERQVFEGVPGDETSWYGATVDTVLRTDYAGIAQARRCYVLVDSMTASASEILLSCLHDYRALDVTSVGTVTYGKGRGQVILGYDWDLEEYQLTDGGMARITSMLLTPVAGAPYDMVGIMPHVLIQPGQDALDTTLVMISRELGRPLAKSSLAGAVPAPRRAGPREPLLIDDR